MENKSVMPGGESVGHRILPLLLIFITVLAGFSLLINREMAHEKYERECERDIRNLTAKMAIGSTISDDLQQIQSLFLRMIILRNPQKQQLLVEKAKHHIASIHHALEVLEVGGTVPRNPSFPAHAGDAAAVGISYRPGSSPHYLVEIMALYPALLEVEEKLRQIIPLTAARNRIFLEDGPTDRLIREEGAKIRAFVATTSPMFARMKRNSLQILADGQKEVNTFYRESEIWRKQQTARDSQWAIGSVVTVLLLIGLALRQIYSARNILEQQVSARTSALTDANKKLSNEIAVRREVEGTLRQSEREWERTFDAIPDSITIQDNDFRIIRANLATATILDMPLAEIIGRRCFELFHDSETPCSHCPLLLTMESFTPYSHIIHHEKLGRTFQVSAAPLLIEEGTLTHVIHTARDVSQEISLEQQLRQAMKMEAIGTLAGGIAHDFNNILASILGYAEVSKARLSDEDPVQPYILQILKAGNRAKELVKQILAFSRQTEIRFTPLQVHLVVKEALKLLRSSLPATIEIREEIERHSRLVLADPTQIHQIVMNLCTNAKHAMGDGGGVLTVSLSEVKSKHCACNRDHHALGGDSCLDLAVRDTGCGMDEVTRRKLFDPFFTTKSVGEGTGLGLSVVHGIVKAHGGEIAVESSPGQGTVFHVYLPLTDAEEMMDAAVPDTKAERRRVRILLVDDDPDLLEAMRQLLTLLGHRVTPFSRGRDALDAYRACPEIFDLLISDITMPEMTGIDLARQLQSDDPGLPVILCTGYSESVDEEYAKRYGVREFLLKPIDKEKLTVAIAKACGKDSDSAQGFAEQEIRPLEYINNGKR